MIDSATSETNTFHRPATAADADTDTKPGTKAAVLTSNWRRQLPRRSVNVSRSSLPKASAASGSNMTEQRSGSNNGPQHSRNGPTSGVLSSRLPRLSTTSLAKEEPPSVFRNTGSQGHGVGQGTALPMPDTSFPTGLTSFGLKQIPNTLTVHSTRNPGNWPDIMSARMGAGAGFRPSGGGPSSSTVSRSSNIIFMKPVPPQHRHVKPKSLDSFGSAGSSAHQTNNFLSHPGSKIPGMMMPPIHGGHPQYGAALPHSIPPQSHPYGNFGVPSSSVIGTSTMLSPASRPIRNLDPPYFQASRSSLPMPPQNTHQSPPFTSPGQFIHYGQGSNPHSSHHSPSSFGAQMSRVPTSMKLNPTRSGNFTRPSLNTNASRTSVQTPCGPQSSTQFGTGQFFQFPLSLERLSFTRSVLISEPPISPHIPMFPSDSEPNASTDP
ncbi:hypothetical protein BCR39DRAFT_79692 [Naematelia encephala]|uniref:Uncharacterized protein n=1 Tax=Naematelia encephala TaxID=71784 RepID=A0A1Y2BAA6_9TREE|nr:hypothetical protein BCR39DRAFT_79692 [Naematelia encephala]